MVDWWRCLEAQVWILEWSEIMALAYWSDEAYVEHGKLAVRCELITCKVDHANPVPFSRVQLR